jgi:hypothetical protein
LPVGRLAYDRIGPSVLAAIEPPATDPPPVAGAAAIDARLIPLCVTITAAPMLPPKSATIGFSPAESALVTSHGAAMLENSAHKPRPSHHT